ncbi:MAG: AarF/ABC1/UbiB kinase family protein [Nevskiales bacterium]|nr:AarF/ABC1/UbiB kinase family protein [Nevskiales bacterium]
MSDSDPRTKPVRLKTQPLQRNLALARLGFGIGSQLAVHNLRGVFRSRDGRESADREFNRRMAQELADELGQLKGSVMKAGQLLALYGGYFLPAEVVEVLSQLQENSQPVPWSVLAPQVRASLGNRRFAELEVDPVPVGAASLGQVHRARRRRDGAGLCLKIQYPGVADAIDSDVRTLARLLMLRRLTPRGLDLTPMFAELAEMLRQEVDYDRERCYIEAFGQRLADDPVFVVPQVLSEYCGPRVLAMSYESGLRLDGEEVRALPQTRRNALGEALFGLFLREFFDWGMVQTDPHFGNYRVRLDAARGDRIVLLDFGATRSFTPGFVRDYGEVVRGALLRDRPRIVHGAAALGILREDFPQSVLDGFSRMCEVIVEPFDDHARRGTPAELLNASGEYRWARSDLPSRASTAAALSSLTVHFRLPPREILFLHRRLTGVFVALAALGVERNLRAPLLAALGLDAEPDAAGMGRK